MSETDPSYQQNSSPAGGNEGTTKPEIARIAGPIIDDLPILGSAGVILSPEAYDQLLADEKQRQARHFQAMRARAQRSR